MATDKACNNTIPSKTVDLQEGDNVFYILAERSAEIKLFTVILRRHPVYTVTFNTAGGTAVAAQQVEEDGFAQFKQTSRTGYTFAGWSYDFLKPILKNETITASWLANKYRISFDVNGGDELPENTQQVTYDLSFTLPTVSRTGYTFIGWYDGETKMTDGIWQYVENKTLTARWNINHYDFSVDSNVSAGGILTCTNSDTYDYGTEIFLNCQTNLGYTFLGWYEDDELITSKLNYKFNLVNNISITAKFECYQELRDFNFYYDNNGNCIITGILDTQIKEITIPEYAQLSNITILNSALKLEKINVESGSSLYSSFEGILYSKDFKNILYCPKNIENIIIHDNIKNLNERQFENLKNLKYVELNDKIGTIESYVFNGCSSLKTVKLGNGVSNVYATAFAGCNNLANIEYSFTMTEYRVNIEYDVNPTDKLWESRNDIRLTVSNIKTYCSYYKPGYYDYIHSSKGWFFSWYVLD
ncbi:MAG: InlB B-repeat-containing protein [Clostridia bacterium]|nr:InlB B-repeat-containing protein [Clostridia bacterium]